MHALVTGASSGIGEGIAKQLAAAGYDLSLVARREAELERVVRELPGEVEARVVVADLLERESLAALVAEAEAALGPLDVLVNNAGVQIVQRTDEVEVEAGERLLQVNVFAPLRLTLAVLPGMIERGRGSIVDIASAAALTPTPGMVHYSASKAALAAASESLRPELRRAGVHVVTVYPGPVHTPMADAALDRYDAPVAGLPTGTTDVLARRILRAIDKRKPRVIYPRVYALTRAFPIISNWIMARFSPLPERSR